MTTRDHTPGPWIAIQTNPKYLGPWGVYSSREGCNGLLASVDGCFDPEENRSNAILMSAAPDLLAALKLYRKARETGDYTNADEASLDAIVAAQGGAR